MCITLAKSTASCWYISALPVYKCYFILNWASKVVKLLIPWNLIACMFLDKIEPNRTRRCDFTYMLLISYIINGMSLIYYYICVYIWYICVLNRTKMYMHFLTNRRLQTEHYETEVKEHTRRHGVDLTYKLFNNLFKII